MASSSYFFIVALIQDQYISFCWVALSLNPTYFNSPEPKAENSLTTTKNLNICKCTNW
jgi:hypothetical protein